MRKNNKYLNCHVEEERSSDVNISAIFFILLFPFSSHATCTPTPDCASIGYTETSCETDYLACPFDSTKLKCIPCDSSFRYDCSGDNITGGIGSACGGKYVSCECVAGATFSNGSCICDTSCSVGNIYYSDGSCSSCVDNTKTAVGIVVKDNELITSINPVSKKWGVYADDVPDLENLENKLIDGFKGKSNTWLIVNHYGEEATEYAGVYCYNFAPEVWEHTSGEWYLPSADEIKTYLYPNYTHIKEFLGLFGVSEVGSWLWSSTEFSAWYSAMVIVTPNSEHSGAIYGKSPSDSYTVFCFYSL